MGIVIEIRTAVSEDLPAIIRIEPECFPAAEAASAAQREEVKRTPEMISWQMNY